MRDVNNRETDWFRGVYRRHYPDVVRYGLRRLDGMAAAEELAQEVFLVAWRRRSEVPARTLPWLYSRPPPTRPRWSRRCTSHGRTARRRRCWGSPA